MKCKFTNVDDWLKVVGQILREKVKMRQTMWEAGAKIQNPKPHRI